jgi:hypothetical protein
VVKERLTGENYRTQRENVFNQLFEEFSGEISANEIRELAEKVLKGLPDILQSGEDMGHKWEIRILGDPRGTQGIQVKHKACTIPWNQLTIFERGDVMSAILASHDIRNGEEIDDWTRAYLNRGMPRDVVESKLKCRVANIMLSLLENKEGIWQRKIVAM